MSDGLVFSPSHMSTVGWHKGVTVPFGGSGAAVPSRSHPNHLTHLPACWPLHASTFLPSVVQSAHFAPEEGKAERQSALGVGDATICPSLDSAKESWGADRVQTPSR